MKAILSFAIAYAALSSVALAGSAEDSGLDRLSDRMELEGWEAVGRVDQLTGGFCTGALIAPDLVLTAAHCLVDGRDGRPIDPAKIVFRAGYHDGKSVAERRAIQTVVHPDYIDESSGRAGAVTTDIGLIKLESAIPTVLAAPFQIGEQQVGNRVSVVSYARGRAEALSWQRSCKVLEKWEDHGAAAYTCDVTFGSSGSPVFDATGANPQIVSVMSRIREVDGNIISYGPLIREPIVALKQALATSNGVNLSGGGLASVVQQTQGARFVKADQGARFVKP